MGPLRRPDRQHPQPDRAHQAFEVLHQGQAQALLGQATLEQRPRGRVVRATASSRQLFRFCQLDFPFGLGPPAGRYLERSPGGEDVAVIVFAELHSTRASRVRRRRPSRLPPGAEDPEPIPITRVTVIAAEPFEDEGAAREWLERCRDRGETGGDEALDALAHVNRAIGAYRVSAADPRAHDVARDQAARVRLGYGSGARLVDGAWEECIVMPAEHGRPRVRRRMLAPEQEVAGILTGRSSDVQPSEELLLRARLDLDGDRSLAAALQLRIAAEALRAELAREDAADTALNSRVEAAAALSEAAMSGKLTAEQGEQLETLLTEFERAVRRRRYAGTE